MNYLAHVLLSGPQSDWQLGGFLGDFLKGPIASNLNDVNGRPWSEHTVQGVILHRRLDQFVDSHELYKAALETLDPTYRRLAGIAIDVFFDYLLVRHWQRFCDSPIDDFCQDFYRLAVGVSSRMPERASYFISRAQEYRLWQRYGEDAVFLGVIEQISSRLSRKNNLIDVGQHVLEQEDQLAPLFLQLMPELDSFAVQYRQQPVAISNLL